MNKFPDSLRRATPAEGFTLARQMAELTLAERNASLRDMAAHLSASPAPAVELLTAIYFQSVTSANGGWQR